MPLECVSRKMSANALEKVVLICTILLGLIVKTAQAQSSATTGVRDAHVEDVVAALFEHARSESGTRPLSRIYRSDVEKLVCTATVKDGSQSSVRLPLHALYKTAQPDKLSDALRKLADYRDKAGYRRYAVAVWTAQPPTDPVQYWVGIRLYLSSGAEFVDNHFTDDVFYKNNWKVAVVPQCRQVSAKGAGTALHHP